VAARKSKRTPKTKRNDANVLAFPPLPRIPSPPQLPADPRQRRAGHILGKIADVARTSMEVAGPNLVRGFHASAVDLGRLQDALRRGVRRFDDAQLAARWLDILAWIRRVIAQWVQRYKRLKIERHPGGVHVEIETQDDHGYYRYEFDVMR